jgi:hypothetical protein
MKKLVFIAVLTFCLLFQVNSQNMAGNIAFSLVMPDEIDNFNENNLLKLEAKIIEATSKVGVAGKGFYSDFIIYPVVTINELETLSSSMKNMKTVSYDLALFIKSQSDNRIFASYSTTLTGVGSSENAAIVNAIKDFNTDNPEIQDFFEKGAKKIVTYFDNNCDMFVSKADSYSSMGEYEKSLALLMAIPNLSSSCFNKVQSKSISIYKLMINKNCESIILKANSLKASGNFQEALSMLTLIDPISSCYDESKKIINLIETKIEELRKENKTAQDESKRQELEFEKYRLNIIKEIAEVYYAKNPVTYNYYDVVIKKK